MSITNTNPTPKKKVNFSTNIYHDDHTNPIVNHRKQHHNTFKLTTKNNLNHNSNHNINHHISNTNTTSVHNLIMNQSYHQNQHNQILQHTNHHSSQVNSINNINNNNNTNLPNGSPYSHAMLNRQHSKITLMNQTSNSQLGNSGHRNIKSFQPQTLPVQQSLLFVDPSNIFFQNYQTSQLYIHKFLIRNLSSVKLTYTINQLSNIYFQIKTNPKGILLQGQSTDIYVNFRPVQAKLYEERIQIHYDLTQVSYVNIRAIPAKIKRKNSLQMLLNSRTNSKRQQIQNQLQNFQNPCLVKINKNQESLSLNQQILPQASYNLNQINRYITLQTPQALSTNDFLKRYNQIQLFNKEKEIRNQAYLGKKALSPDALSKLKIQREQKKQMLLKKFEQKVIKRYLVQFPHDCPIVDKADIKVVRWDQSKNDPQKVRQNGIKKLQQCIRKQIMNIRFQKVYKLWSPYLEGRKNITGIYGKFLSPIVNQKVIQQNLSGLMMLNNTSRKNTPRKLEKNSSKISLGKSRMYVSTSNLNKSKNSGSINIEKGNGQLELGFTPGQLSRKTISFQFQSSLQNTNYTFQINPRIGFDDQIPIEELPENDQEIMGYENISRLSIDQVSFLLSPNFEFRGRTGDEFEYPFLGRTMKQQDQNSLQILGQIGKQWINQKENQNYQLIFERLKKFKLYNLDQKDSILQLNNTVSQQQINGKEDQYVFSKTLNQTNFTLFRQLAQNYQTLHSQNQNNLDYDCGFYSNIEKYNDKILGVPQFQDILTHQEQQYDDVFQKGYHRYPPSHLKHQQYYSKTGTQWMLQLQQNQQSIFQETIDQNQIRKSLEQGLDRLKQQNLKIKASKIHSWNKFVGLSCSSLQNQGQITNVISVGNKKQNFLIKNNKNVQLQLGNEFFLQKLRPVNQTRGNSIRRNGSSSGTYEDLGRSNGIDKVNNNQNVGYSSIQNSINKGSRNKYRLIY